MNTTILTISYAATGDTHRRHVSTVRVTLKLHLQDDAAQDFILLTTVTLTESLDRGVPNLMEFLARSFGGHSSYHDGMAYRTYTYRLMMHPKDVIDVVMSSDHGSSRRVAMICTSDVVMSFVQDDLDDFAHVPHILMTALGLMRPDGPTGKYVDETNLSERIRYWTYMAMRMRRGDINPLELVTSTVFGRRSLQDAVTYLAQHPRPRLAWSCG